jgi:hypothetical protein
MIPPACEDHKLPAPGCGTYRTATSACRSLSGYLETRKRAPPPVSRTYGAAALKHLVKGSLPVNSLGPHQSTPDDPDQGPRSPSVLAPAVMALSFTAVLTQIQTASQGGAHNLLPVLIAVLLTLTGVARSLQAGTQIALSKAARTRAPRHSVAGCFHVLLGGEEAAEINGIQDS